MDDHDFVLKLMVTTSDHGREVLWTGWTMWWGPRNLHQLFEVTLPEIKLEHRTEQGPYPVSHQRESPLSDSILNSMVYLVINGNYEPIHMSMVCLLRMGIVNRVLLMQHLASRASCLIHRHLVGKSPKVKKYVVTWDIRYLPWNRHVSRLKKRRKKTCWTMVVAPKKRKSKITLKHSFGATTIVHIFQQYPFWPKPMCLWWLIPLSKWVITPVINGISRVNPLQSLGWTNPLTSRGMSHQVYIYICIPWKTECGVRC